MTDAAGDNEPHAPRRLRHALRFRVLEVLRTERLTPHMLRITLTGEELDGFTTAAFGDHVKLFFPREGEDLPVMPALTPDGGVAPPAPGAVLPTARDYTPRSYDAAARELVIDFALHDSGPATDWAAKARPGDRIGVGGPRGSYAVADDFDWYLLVGDETALPAIGRRLEELPAKARAIVLAEVADGREELDFTSAATLAVHWIHRGEAPAGEGAHLEAALARLALPHGDGHAWVACEMELARRLRTVLLAAGHPKAWLRTIGYWHRGASNTHGTVED